MKWIDIELKGTSKSGRTNIWHIKAKDTELFLGWITWFAPWRKYTFAPQEKTVFEQTCLRDIATFIENKTKEHHKAKAKLT